MHGKGYVHRDLKPANLLVGRGAHARTLYLIDFGLANKFKRSGSFQRLPSARKYRNLVGTARYASVKAHKGLEQSPADDLEALAYILAYFAKGELPWERVKAPTGDRDVRHEMIGDKKAKCKPEAICAGLPSTN